MLFYKKKQFLKTIIKSEKKLKEITLEDGRRCMCEF